MFTVEKETEKLHAIVVTEGADWKAALGQCRAQTDLGLSWRLPTAEELQDVLSSCDVGIGGPFWSRQTAPDDSGCALLVASDGEVVPVAKVASYAAIAVALEDK